MPLIAANNAAPSTLADVIQQVKEAFALVGDATPIMIGKKYLDEGVGNPPRVVFVPEASGKVGPPIEMGSACSITHACDVFVRGVESGDDVARFNAAYVIGDRVLGFLAIAAAGRIEFGDYGDGSPTDSDAFGAELTLSFKYSRDVRHDARRWALAPASPDTSPFPAIPPQGELADQVELEVSADPQE